MAADATVGGILDQLRAPDPDGRDVALLRTRLYRFSDDHRHYVLAEALEERLLTGYRLRSATLSYVRRSLAAIRVHGRPLPFPDDVASAEHVDIPAEIAARLPYAWHRVPQFGGQRTVTVVVGAPRSGTSHLINLLARTGAFGYFTTASCWAWPVRNLHHPARRLFTTVGEAVLAVDNKRTRVIPALVMPGEAEDVWSRAAPVYRHIASHRYEITPPQAVMPKIVQAATGAHANFFGCTRLLVKSPFHCFRIPHIETIWGPAVRYIHIVRDRRGSADSMRRNRFEFLHRGRLLTAEEAWQMFVDAVYEQAPSGRLLTVTHRELLTDPAGVIARILGWLGAPAAPHHPGLGSSQAAPQAGNQREARY
jgi:hypothetical protein